MEVVTVILSRDKKIRKKEIINVIETEIDSISEIYNKIFLIFGRDYNEENNDFYKKNVDILGKSRSKNLVRLRKSPVSNISCPPIGIININLTKFNTYPKWKKMLAIRHEMCHLLNPYEDVEMINNLLRNNQRELVFNFVKYRREYGAHLCVIKKDAKNWIKEPIGWSGDMISPEIFFKREKEKTDKLNALKYCIANIIHIISVLYLYDQLPKNLQLNIKEKKGIAEKLLNKFFEILIRESKSEYDEPFNWISQEEFLKAKKYYEKISSLLSI